MQYGLGDQYVIVNADGSLSIPSPDAVTVERDRIDYRSIIGVTVEMRSGDLSLFDEYRADGRTLTIKEGADGRSGSVVSVQEFPNLIGRLPVVHLANGRSANETNGHSIHETLRPLYDQYDDLIYKQLDGAKLLGNPLLAFVGMEDINAVINANEPAEADTYTDKDGNIATRTQLNIDTNAVLLVGKGGNAKFCGPAHRLYGGHHAGAQESLLPATRSHRHPRVHLGQRTIQRQGQHGNPDDAMGTRHRSAAEGGRDLAAGLVRDLAGHDGPDRWQHCARLVELWPPLIQEDEEIRLKYLEFAKLNGLLSDVTVLKLLHLVDNAEDETEAAARNAAEH